MQAEQIDWPYDADRDDPLAALRIPVVGSPWPRWFYIVAFDSGRLDGEQLRPTDREARMMASFLEEYIDHWYNERWKAKLAERPFDIDGGANGIVFRKWGDDDWGYRRRTWNQGPTYVPTHPRVRVHTIVDEMSPRWIEWKAAHPEVFGDVPDAE